MKKSIEILGLPIISITEGRELGVSKSLLIDAQNGVVAAVTIDDDDWYRGVKLIPYEAIIAIGKDAVTITHSENILTLEEAGDYERLLVENIRVIGTKAITKSGRIQGKVTEVFIGDGGRIEKCEVTSPDGSISEVLAEQIAIFGKQVTVVDIDEEKKNNLTERPAFEPAFEAFSDEPAQEVWSPPVEETQPEFAISSVEETQPEFAISSVEETQPEFAMPPVEESQSEPEFAISTVEETQPEFAIPSVEETQPEPEFEISTVEESQSEPEFAMPSVEETQPESEFAISPVEETQPEPEFTMPPVEEATTTEETQAELEGVMTPDPAVEKSFEPAVEIPVEQPAEEEQAPVAEEDKKIAAMTRQAEDLKAALKKARASQQVTATEPEKKTSQKSSTKAVDDRRRRVLLGKHATKTIATENGTIVVEAGAEVTEEVLQRARLSNKFIELSMNIK